MKILIINPNSNDEMTEDIKKSAVEFANNDFDVDCVSTPNAPNFIENYEDELLSAGGMINLVRASQEKYDGFVVACHCDPNLDLLKEISDKPIVGIAEASMKLATMLGHKFSVISTDNHSTPNKEALARKYHLENLLASVRVPEIEVKIDDYEEYCKVAKRAIREDGAEVIVLGCSGLTKIRQRLQEEVQIPVLDSVICGLIVVSGFIKHGVSISKVRRYKAVEVDI